MKQKAENFSAEPAETSCVVCEGEIDTEDDIGRYTQCEDCFKPYHNDEDCGFESGIYTCITCLDWIGDNRPKLLKDYEYTHLESYKKKQKAENFSAEGQGLKAFSKRIDMAKKKLVKKAKRSGFRENFGVDVSRNLGTSIPQDISRDELEKYNELFDNFQIWLDNLDLRSLEYESETFEAEKLHPGLYRYKGKIGMRKGWTECQECDDLVKLNDINWYYNKGYGQATVCDSCVGKYNYKKDRLSKGHRHGEVAILQFMEQDRKGADTFEATKHHGKSKHKRGNVKTSRSGVSRGRTDYQWSGVNNRNKANLEGREDMDYAIREANTVGSPSPSGLSSTPEPAEATGSEPSNENMEAEGSNMKMALGILGVGVGAVALLGGDRIKKLFDRLGL